MMRPALSSVSVASCESTSPMQHRSSTMDHRGSLKRQMTSRRRSSLDAYMPDRMEGLGRMSLERIAPELYQDLVLFRDTCRAKFHTTENTWKALLHECLKTDMGDKLRKVEFSRASRMIGFKGNAEGVFDACDFGYVRYVLMEDLRWLRIDDHF